MAAIFFLRIVTRSGLQFGGHHAFQITVGSDGYKKLFFNRLVNLKMERLAINGSEVFFLQATQVFTDSGLRVAAFVPWTVGKQIIGISSIIVSKTTQ